ncbi:MAG: alanine--glyoxylate aminotransferase family protein [Planctomycetes bacterium]|nr:alanine--glyoxylate aminotransferase family protein [Planctomycetota bacterium]
MHKKLFIPGPVEVYPDVLKVMSTPMIGHRGGDYHKLHASIRPKLKELMHTQNDVFISTSSGTGVMEACIRNMVGKRSLSCVTGAFSERWFKIVGEAGKEGDALSVEWGKAVKPAEIDKALATGKYDTFCLVHNETSTGIMQNLEEIAPVLKKYPEIVWCLDTVSSMGGVKIEVDKFGVDVCLASSQKALAMPPGIAVFCASKKALARAATVKGRGHYFDFLAFKKSDEKDETPTTPAVTMFFVLDYQLGKMLQEGLENRYARHVKMAQYCRTWAQEKGLKLFPEKGYESVTLTAIDNVKNFDVAALNKELGNRGFTISDGYGQLKGKTFRIAHMGDTQLDELKQLLDHINDILKLK